jgi:uncharacterized protein (TIGR03437 family)
VTVTAKANDGYRFRRWSGDAAGTYEVTGVSMSVPRSVVAMMDEVPTIGKVVVRNAAGETPDLVVAAGSIVSIYGSKLALWTDVGITNPLPQTIGGVTVWLHDHVLALLYVSDGQINAILPVDLPDGEYTLTVQRSGLPDVSGRLILVRHGPGIFSRYFNGQVFVLASHEDGTPVTPDSPARRDEVISIYGTGFGPYEQVAPYGFMLPASPEYPLADPIEVFAGATTLEPEFVGGAAGFSGTNVLKIRITDKLPPASTVEFRVRAGGHDSNTGLLPLE